MSSRVVREGKEEGNTKRAWGGTQHCRIQGGGKGEVRGREKIKGGLGSHKGGGLCWGLGLGLGLGQLCMIDVGSGPASER